MSKKLSVPPGTVKRSVRYCLGLIIAVLFSFGHQVDAQQLNRDGFILKSPVDTLYGSVRYLSFSKGNLELYFTPKGSQKEDYYAPADLYGYGLTDDITFLSKKIENGSYRFLELIYEGSVSLYGYRDQNSRDHYYLENKKLEEFRKLTFKMIKIRQRQKRIDTYKDVFRILLPRAGEVEKRIRSTSLRRPSLVALLHEHDGTTPDSFDSYESKEVSSPWRLKLVAAVGLNELQNEGFVGKITSTSPSFGLGLTKQISRSTNRMFLETGFWATPEKFDGRIINTVTVFNLIGTPRVTPVAFEINHNAMALKVPLIVRYRFPGTKRNLVIMGGGQGTLNISRSGSRGEIVGNQITEFVNPALTGFQFGFLAGIGIDFNTKVPLNIDVRYVAIVPDRRTIKINTLQFVLGIGLPQKSK